MVKRTARSIGAQFGFNGLNMADEKIIMVPIDKPLPYPFHPFQLHKGERMEQLINGIKEDGLIQPIILHLEKNGEFHVLSGHNRLYASKKAGYKEVPAIIRQNLTKSQQIRILIQSNFDQRGLKDFTIIEQAKAFQLEYEALLEDKVDLGNNTTIRGFLAKKYGKTDSTMQRILSLNKLIPEFIKMMEEKKLIISAAYIVATLSSEEQMKLLDYCKDKSIKITSGNAYELCQKVKDDILNEFDCFQTKNSNKKTFTLDTDIMNNVISSKDMSLIVNGSLRFSQIELPEWLNKHELKITSDKIFQIVIRALEVALEKAPEIFQ